MPNGFHHRDELDVLTLAYTEQGYPEFRTSHTYEGLRIVHTLGHRGYQPMVDWTTWRDPEIPRVLGREIVEGIAAQYVTSLAQALGNPNDSLDPTLRRASLAWFSFKHGWAILFGEYHLFGRPRTGDGPLVAIEPAWNAPPELAEVPAEYREMMIYSDILVEGLSPMATVGGCVFELGAYREIVCATARLQDEPEWERIATAPSIDDEVCTGAIITCLRRRAHRRERDQLAIRWRRP